MQWYEFLEKHPHAVSILISKLPSGNYIVSVAGTYSLPHIDSENAHITKWSSDGYGTSVQEAFEKAFENLKLQERTQR